jgi:CheY-like chemotaxis protein
VIRFAAKNFCYMREFFCITMASSVVISSTIKWHGSCSRGFEAPVTTSGEFTYVRRLQILHIEDSEDDAELIRMTLQAGGLECDITRIQTEAELKNALQNHSFDLILADYNLPSFDGAAALEIAVEVSPRTPFILATGSLGEELAVETLKQGATDFVLKDRLSRLTPAVVRAIHESQEKQNRKRAERALKESEEKYRSFVETTNDRIWSIDYEMRIPYSSPSVEGWLQEETCPGRFNSTRR